MYRKHLCELGILGVFCGLSISGCALILTDVCSGFQYPPGSQYICRNVLNRVKGLWRNYCYKKVVVVLKEEKASSETKHIETMRNVSMYFLNQR